MSAFATKLRTNVHNVAFLKQLSKVGIYAEFEGLLSCHGDEIGMLEDMMIAVEDLINVSFSLKQAERMEEIAPIISRKR